MHGQVVSSESTYAMVVGDESAWEDGMGFG
jgi:hypothetical protein